MARTLIQVEPGLASRATDLKCSWCSRPAADRELLCECGGPLIQQYRSGAWTDADSSRLRRAAPGVWRYLPWLPVRDPRNIVTLGEGATPLVSFGRVADELGLVALEIKDEGRNPTGTFKARGASVAVSRLVELGYRKLAMPTVGSGGSAWAAYAARAGIEIMVGYPSTPAVPAIGPLEAKAYGAKVSFEDGNTETAFLSFKSRASAREAIYVGAFREPYRLEGE